jgi:hypothetical protein
MINLNGYGRKRPWPNLSHYTGICLEELKKATKNLSQDSRFSGRDLKPKRPEYEALTATFGFDKLV